MGWEGSRSRQKLGWKLGTRIAFGRRELEAKEEEKDIYFLSEDMAAQISFAFFYEDFQLQTKKGRKRGGGAEHAGCGEGGGMGSKKT